MAEYAVDDPVWARPHGNGEPVDLAAFGVPAGLVAALRAWNTEFERTALTDFEWLSPQHEQAWRAEGLRLTAELRKALPSAEIWFWKDGIGTRSDALGQTPPASPA